MEPSQVLIGDKPAYLDDDFSGIEVRLQNIGKDVA
jgi:hypothetical protein